MNKLNSRLPLVIILGATGTGKTKLSLQLAQKFGGEIVSADAMQLYKGLDIITAKATLDERNTVPHHLIDILHPHETFTVLDYRNKAVSIIDELLLKNKPPIIVGGTNYYIESLLWKILIEDVDTKRAYEPGQGFEDHTLPSADLHKHLEKLDPDMAKRLHPNNKRKILRSLEVLHTKGKKHSDILKEQQKMAGGSSSGGALRYQNALVLWLQCDQKILDDRLNARVDTMIKEGLINELTSFHNCYNKERVTNSLNVDYTKGIFQSIGLKEFHDYLMLSNSDRACNENNKLLFQGIEKLKMVTRRYARKQNKWINNRFLGRIDRQVPPLYNLDTTDPSAWLECVENQAIDIVESFILNKSCDYKVLPFNSRLSTANAEDITFNCEVCKRVFVGTHQWNLHQKSNRHKRMVQRLNKVINSA